MPDIDLTAAVEAGSRGIFDLHMFGGPEIVPILARAAVTFAAPHIESAVRTQIAEQIASHYEDMDESDTQYSEGWRYAMDVAEQIARGEL